MNYDKLSRSIRQYYKKGIIRKPDVSQRLVYQFVHPVWGDGGGQRSPKKGPHDHTLHLYIKPTPSWKGVKLTSMHWPTPVSTHSLCQHLPVSVSSQSWQNNFSLFLMQRRNLRLKWKCFFSGLIPLKNHKTTKKEKKPLWTAFFICTICLSFFPIISFNQ